MRLAWVVGRSSEFEPHGATPVAQTRRKRKPFVPLWLRRMALLASAAGHAHDIGKATRMFQRKLYGALRLADCVRHEWLSVQVWRRMRAGQLWRDAWQLGGLTGTALCELPPFMRHGVRSGEDAMDFLIASHHRLFGHRSLRGASGSAFDPPDNGLHVRPDLGCKAGDLEPQATLDRRTIDLISTAERRLSKLPAQSEAAWWTCALFARVALIFADHSISAVDYKNKPTDPDADLYANTSSTGKRKRTRRGGNSHLNQPLPWHLNSVGALAADAAVKMHNLKPEGLSPQSVDSILEPSRAESRFAWQDTATEALQRLRENTAAQVLVLNIAATGTGKTRMNAKAMCALARGPVRFAVVLNLRSLTLQTGDAMRSQLQVAAEEMSVVIGDPLVQQLHGSAGPGLQTSAAGVDEDENPPVEQFEAEGGWFDVPAWLETWVKRDGAQRRLIGAPLLVSTIDYLVAAGEPQKQQHHVNAVLRLLSGSDIVIDEIDGYEPRSLVAVLRLVQMAALCGRSVVASSATLAHPVAKAVHSAFRSGVAMRKALIGEDAAQGVDVALISDAQPPRVLSSLEDFEVGYRHYVEAGLKRLDMSDAGVYRYAKCWAMIQRTAGLQRTKGYYADHFAQPVDKRAEAWMYRVAAAVKQAHEWQSQPFGDSGKRLSFGLVRVARIQTAVALTKHLVTTTRFENMEFRVACYHSQDFLIQRYLKEQRLDTLLRRSAGDGHIVQDKDISAIVKGSEKSDVVFIVVATPVEEIGRDHDFDWAVVEPSSTQSIVQVAGRVNRHRLVKWTIDEAKARPNVLVLDLNYEAVVKGVVAGGVEKSPEKDDRHWPRPVFHRPGLELQDMLYRIDGKREVSIRKLLAEEFVVDARLRFRPENYLFAKLDDESIENQTSLALDKLKAAAIAPSELLVAQNFYEGFPLRDRAPRQTLRLARSNDSFRFERFDRTIDGFDWKEIDMQYKDFNELPHARSWLAWNVESLARECVERGLKEADGLRVETRWMDDLTKLKWDASFGWYRA